MTAQAFISVRTIIGMILLWGVVLVPISQAKELLTFEGQADLTARRFNVKILSKPLNVLTLSVEKKSKTRYEVIVNIDHWATGLLELSTVLTAALDIQQPRGQSPVIKGKLSSQYTLIDFLPVQDFFGQFQIRQQKLIIDNLMIGDVLIKGEAGLQAPHDLSLRMQLANMDLFAFLNFLMQKPDLSAEGSVSGDIQIMGNLQNVQLRGALDSPGGRVNKWVYNDAKIHLEGGYPIVNLVRSTIVKDDGLIFGVTGALDLSDRKNYIKQIKALTLLPYVQEHGQSSEWTLKRSVQADGKGRTELKYILRDEQSESNPLNNDRTGMLGVEHKMQW